jgi:hypothetical protein
MVQIAPVAAVDFSACADTIPGEDISDACMRVIQSFPEPQVIQAPVDGTTLNNYTFWRVSTTSPNLYNAPGGAVIGQMPAGFNFVHSINESGDDWIQIESGEWMMTEDLQYRPSSRFTGVRVLDGLQKPFGWILGTHITSPYPGAPQNIETGRVVYRYDRVNLFAAANDEDGWEWYMVGPDEWVDQRMITRAMPVERPDGVEGRWVAIDLYEQSLVAYENDTPVFATVIATGLPGWDTHEGLFEVWARLPVDGMSGATGAPDAYALQSVPWVMYFDDSISLHGTYWHNDFGYRRSHGCVNMSISDARYIFEWFLDAEPDANGDIINHVYVYSSGEYRTSGAATK